MIKDKRTYSYEKWGFLLKQTEIWRVIWLQ